MSTVCRECIEYNRLYCTRDGLPAVAIATVVAPSGTVLVSEALCALHKDAPLNGAARVTPVNLAETIIR